MHDQQAATRRRLSRVLVAGFILVTLFGVGVTSRDALVTVVLDGLTAATVLVPAGLAGLWLVPCFKPGPLPLRWHLLLGAALGLGSTSLLVLLLGLAGVLQRPVWVIVEVMFAVAGVARLRTLLARQRDRSHFERSEESPCAKGSEMLRCAQHDKGLVAERYLWLLTCPFLVLALLAASNAPGLIWQEEGFGYDVLEYHLELPKEYFEAGRIAYAPHNVYANFPANVEMLYLLAMILLDDVRDVGTTANMIHLCFAVLTVFAAWVAGREWSPRTGAICGVSMATAGWLAYLCGLAYVENGMLFYGMATTAILLRGTGILPVVRGSPAVARPHLWCRCHRWVALAGIVAGFACGCKYIALPMIAMPLGLAAIFLCGCSIRRKITYLFVFTVATLMTFSPWLIKNQVMTGNPVFPLMNRTFAASPPGWGEEETERWNRGHSAGTQQQTVNARIGVLWDHVLWDKYHRFGPAILVLAIVGLFKRRWDRIDLVLLLVTIVQLGVWLFATHLLARFAVVLLIPLALLAGRAALATGVCLRQWFVTGVLIAGSAWNFANAVTLHQKESLAGAPSSLVYDGQLPGYEYFSVVNHELLSDAKILLVGDAKAFYFQRKVDYHVTFNRNPFLSRLLTADSEWQVIDWLRRQGYTHVLVNFSEVRRLALTYGFSPAVDPNILEQRFDRLSAAGLTKVTRFNHRAVRGRYVELYEVPR